MLQFLSQWLAQDPAHLGASLAQLTSHPAYDLDELRGDLERFTLPAARQQQRTTGRPITMIPGPPAVTSHRRQPNPERSR